MWKILHVDLKLYLFSVQKLWIIVINPLLGNSNQGITFNTLKQETKNGVNYNHPYETPKSYNQHPN